MAGPKQSTREKPPASTSACTWAMQAEQFSRARKAPFEGATQYLSSPSLQIAAPTAAAPQSGTGAVRAVAISENSLKTSEPTPNTMGSKLTAADIGVLCRSRSARAKKASAAGRACAAGDAAAACAAAELNAKAAAEGDTSKTSAVSLVDVEPDGVAEKVADKGADLGKYADADALLAASTGFRVKLVCLPTRNSSNERTATPLDMAV